MNAEEQLSILEKVVDLMEQQMGPNCEIVLHDLRKPYDCTIVDIRNGHITGRSIGDCGSDRGLEVIRGTVKNGDEFNYITHTKDGKTLRSSSAYFRDDDGKVIASLCVNQDITDTLRLEKTLHDINMYDPTQSFSKNEVFAQNVGELLDNFVQESQIHVGKRADQMNRSEKMEMLRYLDQKGVFLITRSGERICEVLNISKFTLYNYLDILRKEAGNSDKKETK